MVRSSTLGLAAVLLLAACNGDRRDPISPRGQGPALGINDGAHNGNPDFFFLPPMAANPSSRPEFNAGAFNAKLLPVVTICRLDAATASVCEADIKTFDASAISVGTEEYHVNWNTSESALEVSRLYRISVTVGTEVIGYIDVDPVNNGKELRSVNTNEYIGLVDGRTLPIKFRIEKGVTCANKSDCAEQAVTNSGGIVLTNTGYAGVDFPSGWLPVDPRTGKPYQNVTVKIERVAVGPDNRCHADLMLLQFEGCYEFTTDPYIGRFAQPVVAGICPELDQEDPRYHQLVLYTSGPNETTEEAPEAPAPFVNCDGFTGTPAQIGSLKRAATTLLAFAGHVGTFLAPKPAYAIDLGWGGELMEFSRGGWALPAELEIVSGDAQTAAPGSTLATPISVRAVGHHGRPVSGIPVTFTPGTGTVSATGPVVTDANGIATTTWTLGTASGAQTLTVGGNVHETLTFSATALQVLASVTLSQTRVDFGLQQTGVPVPITQLDGAGSPMSASVPCTWAVTSNRQSMAVTQSGVLSASQADNGVVTATCNGITGSALVESGDFQYVTSGNIQDPNGDATTSQAGAPDLVGVTVSMAQQRLTFTVTFDLNSVLAGNEASSVSVDTDQQTSTGHPGVAASGTIDDNQISADYLVRIENGSASLMKYAGTVNSFTPVATASCTISNAATTRSHSCSFALSQFGYDDGFVNFKATSSAKLSTGGYSGILDVASDVGSAPGTTGYVVP